MTLTTLHRILKAFTDPTRDKPVREVIERKAETTTEFAARVARNGHHAT